MTSPLHPRAKDLFLAALELDAGERTAFLEGLEREDPALGAQVHALLAAHSGAAAEDLERLPRTSDLVDPPHAPGMVLEDYELLEEIGSGASGSVWRARQLSLDRVVALKLLRGGRLAGAREMARLRAEAEAIARLDHPHIVPVHGVGEHEGHPFFSMRWIEGGALSERLEEPWTARSAALLLVDVARAVHHAHQRGLLHRDLKPSNVLLDAEGRPHVVDFGIAKRLDREGGGATTEVLAGTPAYMAPEQAEGGELTVATDVFALGCILYELLSARPAFGGGSVSDILRRIRTGAPTPLRRLRPDVPRDLATIVAVCLRKEPGRRYPSADALAEDLERWLAHEPIAARRTGALERVVLFGRRSPLAATMIALAAGLLLLLTLVATWASVQLGARLRESYLGEARATRLAGGPGARWVALDLLSRAAAIRPGADLRDEAIASMAMPDLELERAVEQSRGIEGYLTVDPALGRLAYGVEDGLHLLRFEDGAELAALGPREHVGLVRWSPGGRFLLSKYHAAANQGSGARFLVWDPEALTAVLERADAIAYRAADFDADERRLAYATLDKELVVLGLPDGEELLREDLGAAPYDLAFGPRGERIALVVRGEERRLEVRDARTGATTFTAALQAEPFDVEWRGDGRGLAVACADFQVHLIDPDGVEPERVCQGHSAEVTELLAAPVGPLLATSSWDGTTRLWDASTGRELRHMAGRSLGFDPDGRRLATADARGWSAWRVENGAFLRTVRVHSGKSPRGIAFSADGARVVTVGPDGALVWDVHGEERPERVSSLELRAARFLPDGGSVLLSGPTGLLLCALDGGAEPRALAPGPFWGLALTTDGRTAITQGPRSIVMVDPLDPATRRELPGHPNMEYLTASADGNRVAVGNWRGDGVLVWTPGTSDEPLALLPGVVNVAVALSPDGALLATSTSERLELRRAVDGALIHLVEQQSAFGSSPCAVSFSPDGGTVAFQVPSETVRLVDTRSFRTTATLEPPDPGSLFAIAFSPDGSLLGTVSGTNHARLWDLASLRGELARLGLDARR